MLQGEEKRKDGMKLRPKRHQCNSTKCRFRASIFVSPTAERAADVDANGPHVGLVRITDAVVEGDEDAEGGKQQTQDQQEHSQGVQDYIDTSYVCQRRNHYTHGVQEHNGYMELTCIILFLRYHSRISNQVTFEFVRASGCVPYWHVDKTCLTNVRVRVS